MFAPATITPEEPKGEPIMVLFNPTQYQLEKSIRLAPMPTPGLETTPAQYVHGDARVLSMDLFFDTYGASTDVRDFTNQIYALATMQQGEHKAVICRFTWGEGKWGLNDDSSFRCMLERVSGRFTMFLADGTPVRAMLSVTFREYIDPKVSVQRTGAQSADHTKSRTVQRGETLMSIAAEEYGSALRWRPIAAANHVANPRLLEPGRALVIPALDEKGQAR